MQKELEEELSQLKTSRSIDPDKITTLNAKAQGLKESAPHDALNIYRTLAMVVDNGRLFSSNEKLQYFTEASDLGWKLQELKWHFDRRAAELQREAGNLPLAGDQYERAAKSFIQEGLDNKNDWLMQFQMLREARICYEVSGYSDDASRCFIKGMKLRRDNAKTFRGKAKGWVSYIFWSWGESPLKVGIWGAVLIIFFAVSYYATGILTASCESKYDFTEALYFSIVTFTTLGYGDFSPALGIGRLLAAIEALSGIFSMLFP